MRASQSLFNVGKMKELAQMRHQNNRASKTVDRSANGGNNAVKDRQKNTGANNASVQHAMSSLSGVRDSKKFGEVLDKMFVPTVQAYRQKEKERPFRRPTQNPRPSKGSSSPSQRAAARQRYEAKQRLI